MDPVRLRILKNLSAVLEQVTPAAGYQHDLTGRVFRGRSVFGHSDPVPMVSILEAIKDPDLEEPPAASPMTRGPWELLIQGWVEDDHTNPTDPAYFLLADIKKRLVQERVRDRQRDILGMGNVITEIKLSQGVVRPPEDGISSKAYFWLRVTLVLVENLNEPYA